MSLHASGDAGSGDDHRADPHGVYVHVPWCRARCPYCAFAVVPGEAPPDWPPFVARVLAEYDQRRFPGRPTTAYLGGGTPSRLPPEAIAALVAAIDASGEVTAEVNPEDLTDDWLAGAVAAGVNRVSLGVQSLTDPIARRLGRGHTSKLAEAAIDRVARSPLRTWSLDLMFAVPGQTLRDLDDDLDRVIAAGAPHVSVYGLTFEPGTRFESARARGKLVPLDDDGWRAMYDRLVERLAAAGIHRYEVSNFARDGHRSAHNRLYWTDRPYVGLGPSAHGYAPDGQRWVNVAELDPYLVLDDPTASRETPSPAARATDRLVSGLRSIDGIDLDRLGVPIDPRVIEVLVRNGLVTRTGDHLALTDAGFPVCDGIVARLVDALEP
ncbi:MAG: radical SAM family heme chaperone HemW [Myxococcota bacterium]